MKTVTSHLTALLATILILCLLPGMRVQADSPVLSHNLHGHNYSTWATASQSALYLSGDRKVRVEAVDGTLYVETYGADDAFVSQKRIPMELPLFGGFYRSDNAFYVMYGQENTDESEDVEVVRIVKYDRDWNPVGRVSYRGINTRVPFEAGASDMCEAGGCLYVRTCHKMFRSSDGLNHQANLSFVIDMESMTSISVYDYVQNVSQSPAGYVSHSFNQFLVAVGNRIASVDHGDANPRSVVLCDYGEIGGGDYGYDYLFDDGHKVDFDGMHDVINLLDFPGRSGANYTGASVGGFEASETNYLTAVSHVTYDDDFNSNRVRNVSVLVQPIGGPTEGAVQEVLLSHDTEAEGRYSNETPYLVKVGKNLFVVLWELRSLENGAENDQFRAVVVDGQGRIVSPMKTFRGSLSDCQPVSAAGEVVWYVTGEQSYYSYGDTAPIFYHLYVEQAGNASCDLVLGDPGEGEGFDPDLDPDERREMVEAFVERMYTCLMKRPAEADGKAFWSDQILNHGMAAAECAKFFVLESDEFVGANYDNDAFLDRLYPTFFGEGRTRTVDAEGFAFWTEMLERGYSRKWVLAGFVNSEEFSGICSRYGIKRGEITLSAADTETSDLNLYVDTEKVDAYIDRLYRTILGRTSEADGKAFWTGLISRHEMTAQRVAVEGFFFAPEYLQKETTDEAFVDTLYLALLDRDPAADPDGYAFWVGALKGGMDRMTVIEQGFGDSPEFRQILQSYGLLRK
ncbi:MAG: DUF4214 domain-containing protein [Lachnospiraceae bacterium]|nr:DUF4214 domain-containing protein [Lachnospiraceae bacterium]